MPIQVAHKVACINLHVAGMLHIREITKGANQVTSVIRMMSMGAWKTRQCC